MIDFSRLYDEQIDNLIAFGSQLTADHELLKDCIHDVFVKLYTRRNSLSEVSNIENYLHIALRNRINDEYRRSTHLRDGEISDTTMRLLAESEETSRERMARQQALTDRVERCVNRLSPRQQQLINLYYMEHRKYDDICRIMGINYQSVRNLMHRSIVRLREYATHSVAVFIMAFLLMGAFDAVAQPRYQVGVCDWMVLKRQKLGEFALAHQLCADGVELDMGGLGQRELWDNQLRASEQAAHFRHVADSLGVQIGAVAMSGLYAQDLTQRDNYMALVADCFDTMERMGCQSGVAFLPLGGCGNDWATDKAKRREVVRRLHDIGEAARARGLRVGIDTPLDAKENLRLLKEIKSPGIGIFYKLQTAVERGVDIAADLRRLGAKNICAIHASNTDGVWLQNDAAINMPQIRHTLDQMGWQGWLFVERSRDTTMVRNVKMNYGANVRYLKEVFGCELPEPQVKLDSAGRPADYVETIVKRSQKVTDELGITYTRQGRNVLNIVCNRYFKLNDIYAERDSLKEVWSKEMGSKVGKPLAEAQCDSRLYRSHGGFLADLSMYLSPKEIETVKDVMTFNVVRVTYEAQCDMIPTLKDEEKQQIMAWLLEARELAIDAESSKKKHEVFGKYKGRINNYLSRQGYDLNKEREAWYERVKARGGKI